MKPETVKRWSLKLWPQLTGYPPAVRQQGFLLMGLILTTWPYFPLALVWLTAVTDWQILRANALILLILLIINMVIEQRPYLLLIRPNEDTELPLSSSLSGIIDAAAFFIFGPSALWLGVTSGLLRAAWQAIEARRTQNQHPVWYPLSTLLQTGGISTITWLLALAVYVAAGSAFPLATPQPQQWLPALLAVLVVTAAQILLYTPIFVTLNRLNEVPNTPATLLPIMVSPVLMTLATIPFAIPVAVVYSETSTAVFIALILGIALANLLAYALSRASITNQARIADLAWLEALSKALIQAPPDASTIAGLLTDFLPRQFRQQRIMVKLFTLDVPTVWPQFEVTYPPSDTPPNPPIDWESLRRSNDSSLLYQNVPARQGTSELGNELLVKIMGPLQADGEPVCVGGIYLHRGQDLVRSPRSLLPTLQDLASQIGAALTRARSHADTLSQQKMAQELAVAGRIQASFLPSEVPQVLGYEIAATLIPARQTSGDFYDFIPLPHGRVGLLVADVADKGTGAALYMALSRTLIRTYAMQFPDNPAQALAAANERILADTESDQFVTVFYAVLDAAHGRFVYANAGHNPAFLMNGEVEKLANTGMPLGMFSGVTWQQQTRTLAPDGLLVIYSDGVSEAQDAARAEFGEARMLATLADHSHSAHAAQQALINAVHDFVGRAPQFDDITLMVVRREPQ